MLRGAPGGGAPLARRLAQAHVPQDALGLPDRVERRAGADGDAPADGRGRREGASRAEALTMTDLRHIVDPDDVAATHALAARLARVMRARLVRRDRCAGAAAASTCAAPFIATSRTAEPRSTSPGDAARSSRYGSSCCSMPRAR
jgi:hypothetical protein